MQAQYKSVSEDLAPISKVIKSGLCHPNNHFSAFADSVANTK